MTRHFPRFEEERYLGRPKKIQNCRPRFRQGGKHARLASWRVAYLIITSVSVLMPTSTIMSQRGAWRRCYWFTDRTNFTIWLRCTEGACEMAVVTPPLNTDKLSDVFADCHRPSR